MAVCEKTIAEMAVKSHVTAHFNGSLTYVSNEDLW